MQWGYVPLLYFVAVLGLEAEMLKECRIIEALQNKLTYQQRLKYMKHYFPINYTVSVQFEEVLRMADIVRLRDQNVDETSLRYLWLNVNSQVLLKICAMLLEKHPSWKYMQDLCHLFDSLVEEYDNYNQDMLSKVFRQLGFPQVDLLASETKKKCKKFYFFQGCSPGSIADTFLILWKGQLFYNFPPMPLNCQLLVKINYDRSAVILVPPASA